MPNYWVPRYWLPLSGVRWEQPEESMTQSKDSLGCSRWSDYLKENAVAYTDKHDIHLEAALKVINNAETNKWMYQQIWCSVSSPKSGTISKLLTPLPKPASSQIDTESLQSTDEPITSVKTEWELVYNSSKIYHIILHQNFTKLS